MNQKHESRRPPVCNESGIEIKPVYVADDVERSGGWDGIGQPGEYPFTRGIHPRMYRERPWTMRQYSGFGTAAETHERFPGRHIRSERDGAPAGDLEEIRHRSNANVVPVPRNGCSENGLSDVSGIGLLMTQNGHHSSRRFCNDTLFGHCRLAAVPHSSDFLLCRKQHVEIKRFD